MPEITNIARETVLANGYDYEVETALECIHFDQGIWRHNTSGRELPGIEGHNRGRQWVKLVCVLFPPFVL